MTKIQSEDSDSDAEDLVLDSIAQDSVLVLDSEGVDSTTTLLKGLNTCHMSSIYMEPPMETKRGQLRNHVWNCLVLLRTIWGSPNLKNHFWWFHSRGFHRGDKKGLSLNLFAY